MAKIKFLCLFRHKWRYVRRTPEGKVFECRRCGKAILAS